MMFKWFKKDPNVPDWKRMSNDQMQAFMICCVAAFFLWGMYNAVDALIGKYF